MVFQEAIFWPPSTEYIIIIHASKLKYQLVSKSQHIDSDDKPIYQGIDQAKLVPLLTAALQEEIGKREALESRVVTLEAA